ncbi:hypothetical protein [Psychrobacillus sp. FSL H8-0510]|uniref:hypothetical protein n=1 Tax=Psychrobacillus sp. FSL H8-0510 TaxID=2921394 RepID=UPI0030FD1392
MNEQLIETLKIIVIYNQQILEKFDGDQGAAKGLITFVDQGFAIWHPFYDSTLRLQVNPTVEYSEQQLQTMVNQLSQKIAMSTGENCMVDLYKVNVESDVQSIGVTDECIVGYAEQEPFEVEIPTQIWCLHFQEGLNEYVQTM